MDDSQKVRVLKGMLDKELEYLESRFKDIEGGPGLDLLASLQWTWTQLAIMRSVLDL